MTTRELIIAKMKQLFTFPDVESVDDLIINTYLSLLLMMYCVEINDYTENTSKISDLRKIANEIIYADRGLVNDKNVDNVKNILAKLVDFGHIFHIMDDKLYKTKYITANQTYHYKDLYFQMGLPKNLKDTILSGNTFIVNEINPFAEYDLNPGIDLKLLEAYYREQFVNLDTYKTECFDINLKSSYSSNKWISIIDSSDFDLNIARREESNHYIYYLCQKKSDVLKGKNIDENFSIKELEQFRWIFYIMYQNNNVLTATIVNIDNYFVKINLPYRLPLFEKNVLANIGFEISNICYIVRKEFLTLVKDLLKNCYLNINLR